MCRSPAAPRSATTARASVPVGETRQAQPLSVPASPGQRCCGRTRGQPVNPGVAPGGITRPGSGEGSLGWIGRLHLDVTGQARPVARTSTSQRRGPLPRKAPAGGPPCPSQLWCCLLTHVSVPGLVTVFLLSLHLGPTLFQTDFTSKFLAWLHLQRWFFPVRSQSQTGYSWDISFWSSSALYQGPLTRVGSAQGTSRGFEVPRGPCRG